MTDKAACIIGASRGIGLGLAQHLASRGYRVYATERSDSAELAQAADASDGAITVHKADVTDDASIAALAREIGDKALDILVQHGKVRYIGCSNLAVRHILRANHIAERNGGYALPPV